MFGCPPAVGSAGWDVNVFTTPVTGPAATACAEPRPIRPHVSAVTAASLRRPGTASRELSRVTRQIPLSKVDFGSGTLNPDSTPRPAESGQSRLGGPRGGAACYRRIVRRADSWTNAGGS